MNTMPLLHNSTRARLADKLRRLAQQRQRELTQSERALLAQVARELEIADANEASLRRSIRALRDDAVLI